jgi:hypothetical protein
METDAMRLARLRTMAGERGLDVVRTSNGPRESGRGWRLVRLCDRSEIVIGGFARCGATLDDIEIYLGKL